jgi:hypothetical protein
MPWDVIDALNAGGRPLITPALWAEPRAAMLEREDVAKALWDLDTFLDVPVVHARDPVGKIAA